MARKKAEKPKIKMMIELHEYHSLKHQLAYQQGIATAFAGTADVICQFAEYALKNDKLPDLCSEERQKGYKEGMAIAFNGMAEVFNNFSNHLITEGEKLLKEKGWEGLNTEDDLK